MSFCFGKNASAGRAHSVSAYFDINVNVSPHRVAACVCVCLGTSVSPFFPLCVDDSFCLVSAGTGEVLPHTELPNHPSPGCTHSVPSLGGLGSHALLAPRLVCSFPRMARGLFFVCFSSPCTVRSSGSVPKAVSKVLWVKETGTLALDGMSACF